jgi:miniconductance mechanosensitive channel
MIEKYINLLKSFGDALHLGESTSLAFAETIATLSLALACLILYFLVRFIIKKTVYTIIQKSTNKYDDMLVKNKVISRLCLLVPALLFGAMLPNTLPDFPATVTALTKLNTIFEIIIFTMVLNAIANTIEDAYNTLEVSKQKPITSLIQVIRIVLDIVCIIVIIAYLMGTSVGSILISLGTISAVLMLVFQDLIKGFVGGVQLTTNDMLRIGDWIVMGPADGTVLEIKLTTVKVQNWDNTITTIPTYNLVSNPFTNWRGMSESGGRRIARTINIDVNTIHYCTPEMLERYKHYGLVKDYILKKEADILEYNKANRIDTSEIINGRQQTNLGIFRAYIKAYLVNNPKLNHNLTLMVRQMQPSEYGVPLQIYAFSNDKQWVNYEEIQSDLFDHIISAASMFDLKIYQKH